MMMVLAATRCNVFLDCASLMKYRGLLSHNPLWKSFFFGASSCIHDHHMGGKRQAHDLFKMNDLELSHHFFFLPYVDILRDHSIFVFKTYLLVDLHLLLLTTLKPTYDSSIVYKEIIQT
jgi:hypothetical protein